MPVTTSRLSVGVLRAILSHHDMPIHGVKDELVLRVFLLRHGKTASMFNNEEAEIRGIIDVANKLVIEERKLGLGRSTV